MTGQGVSTLTDRRFRRVHIKPSRRRRAVAARRRMASGLVILGLAAYGAWEGIQRLTSAPFLRVDEVVVLGNQRVAEQEVLALLNGLRGQNILMVDLEMYRARLHASGWIAAATLRRVLPATVEVSVSERVPVALARFGSRLYLVDGRVDIIDEQGLRFAGADLPIVDGLPSGSDGEDSNRHVDLAARVLEGLADAPDLLALVSQIDVEDPYDAVVLLHDAPTLVHLGHEQFADRLLQYVELAPALRVRVEHIDYVDMRFDRRVILRPAGTVAARARTMASNRESRVWLQQ